MDLEEICEVVWYERGIKGGINLIWKMGNWCFFKGRGKVVLCKIMWEKINFDVEFK